MKNIKKNIPNAITTTRLLAAIAFPVLFLTGNIVPALLTFAFASASDAIDGYLARKWHVESDYGRQIDPIADKLLSGGALVISAALINQLMFIPLILESIIVVMGLKKLVTKDILPVTKTGKIKTILLFPTIGVGLLSSIVPTLNLILLPLVLGTGALQMATIKSYYDQEKKKRESITKEESNPQQELLEEKNNEENINKQDLQLVPKKQLEAKLLKELKKDLINDLSLNESSTNKTISQEQEKVKKLIIKK